MNTYSRQHTVKLNDETFDLLTDFIVKFKQKHSVKLSRSQAIYKLLKHFNGENEA